jgi:enamine deaminase RidA (YjgF/YER057c/UK114 family)
VVLGVAKMPGGTPVEITVVAAKDLTKKRIVPQGVWAGDRLYLNAIAGPALYGAERELQIAIHDAGLKRSSLVFLNTYNTGKPSQAEIPVAAIPGHAKFALFAIAARDPGEVLRDGCRQDGDTLFCEVRPSSPGGGLEDQTKELFANVKERLTAHGFKLENIVATNVWVNNIDDFQKMNAVYATFFPTAPPTRTTIQPGASVAGAPALRMSVVAVK